MSAAAIGPSLVSNGKEDGREAGGEVLGPGPVKIRLEVDGRVREVEVEPRTTLSECLRDLLGLTAPKEACGLGACGSCSVLLDGKLVSSCSVLALDAEGGKILTAAGLGTPDRMHPLQRSFVENDALQCGFCTPGMIVAAQACLSRNPKAGPEEIRAALSGNLCRCGTYTRIFEAVERVARGGR